MSKKVLLIIIVAAVFINFTQAQAESSIKYNKFLDYIFKKYGSKGVITFEVNYLRFKRSLIIYEKIVSEMESVLT